MASHCLLQLHSCLERSSRRIRVLISSVVARRPPTVRTLMRALTLRLCCWCSKMPNSPGFTARRQGPVPRVDKALDQTVRRAFDLVPPSLSVVEDFGLSETGKRRITKIRKEAEKCIGPALMTFQRAWTGPGPCSGCAESGDGPEDVACRLGVPATPPPSKGVELHIGVSIGITV